MHKVPQYSKVTYCRIICDICPQKKDTHIVQLTVGGDILVFDGPVSTPTSYLTTSKLHWNIIISNPGSKYLVFEVKNFYLNKILAKHVCYKIAVSRIPQEVIDEYNLMDKQINSFICVIAEKGMYVNISDHLDMSLRQSLQDFGATTRME